MCKSNTLLKNQWFKRDLKGFDFNEIKREIKKYLETNKNENPTCQDSSDKAKQF